MTPETDTEPENLTVLRYAFLCVNAHKGQAPQRIAVVQLFEERVRIRALKETTLGGRGRKLKPGETALVPKWTVKNTAPVTEAAATKRAARDAPMKFYAFEVETVTGHKIRYYKGKNSNNARAQAEKVGGVIRVGKSTPVSEAQYIAGRKAVGQD